MKRVTSYLSGNTSRILLLISATICTGILSGCGAKAYEDRFELTSQYYDYIDRLNDNLGPQFAQTGVSMRVPKQFNLVPAPPMRPKKPVAPGEAPADEPEEKPDPRQPKYLDIKLPGLIAAWKSNLNTVTGTGSDSKSSTLQGDIYLLSNAEFWQTYKTNRQSINPVEFHDEVMKQLTDVLGIRIDNNTSGSGTNRVNQWFTESVPAKKDEKFAPKKQVTTITLVPEEGEGGEGYPREYQVFLFANGDMKIVILYALPKNVSASEDIQDRILFSLQTLNVSAEKSIGPIGQPNTPAPPKNQF